MLRSSFNICAKIFSFMNVRKRVLSVSLKMTREVSCTNCMKLHWVQAPEYAKFHEVSDTMRWTPPLGGAPWGIGSPRTAGLEGAPYPDE